MMNSIRPDALASLLFHSEAGRRKAAYNTVRSRSAIGYVTPAVRPAGRRVEILTERDRKPLGLSAYPTSVLPWAGSG